MGFFFPFIHFCNCFPNISSHFSTFSHQLFTPNLSIFGINYHFLNFAGQTSKVLNFNQLPIPMWFHHLLHGVTLASKIRSTKFGGKSFQFSNSIERKFVVVHQRALGNLWLDHLNEGLVEGKVLCAVFWANRRTRTHTHTHTNRWQ